jgi:hypothetical protein
MSLQAKENKIREDRIAYEAIVDAHDSEERALGWHCYVSDALIFPFKAKCIFERRISPLKKGEMIEIVGTADVDDCMHELFVMGTFGDRTFAVPLNQLKPLRVTPEAQQIIADWHYWMARGYEF